MQMGMTTRLRAWLGGSGLALAALGASAAAYAAAGINQSTPQAHGGSGTGCGSDGICLTVTVAEDNGDPTQCGAATSLSVTRGTGVNYCYVVTNQSSATLRYQSLYDSASGYLFRYQAGTVVPIAPGASIQYNRTIAAVDAVNPITVTWTASDDPPGYEGVQGGYDFIDVTDVGTPLNLPDDGSAVLQLPFSFTLYDQTSNQLCFANNGLIGFATEDCGLYIGDTGAPYFTYIAPFWTDLGVRGNVYYATLGTEPSRQFVVEWSQANHYNQTPGTGTVTFEILLDEASGLASFQYQDVTFDDPNHPGWDYGHDAAVGSRIPYSGSNQTLLDDYFSIYTASLTNELKLTWTPRDVAEYSASAEVTVEVGAPTITITPTKLTAAAAVGASTTTTLTISNGGDYPLEWNLDEAASNPRAHFPVVAPIVTPMGNAASSSLTRVGPAPARTSQQESSRDSMSSQPLPLGAEGVSAYAENLGVGDAGWAFVHFPDVANPSTVTIVPDPNFQMPYKYFYAGDFVNNDFSKEYVIYSFYEASNFYFGTLATDSVDIHIREIPNTPSNVYLWSGLKWDATTGTLFAIAIDVDLGSHLYVINPDTGYVTWVGDLPTGLVIIDIAIDPDGHMYGLDIASDALIAIDKTTGDARSIGSIGFNAEYSQGMDFDDATGILYLAGFDGDSLTANMYTVDTTTGAATIIGPSGNGGQYDAFAIAVPATGCAQPTDAPWLSVDPTSGTTTPGASSTLNVTMDATNLVDGTYQANLCVHTNSWSNSRVAVPVQFVVGTGISDVIFDSGFDNSALP